MHDVRRRGFGDGLLDGSGVTNVALHTLIGMLCRERFHPGQSNDVMPGLLQDFAQNFPNKTVGARDEGPLHGRYTSNSRGANERV